MQPIPDKIYFKIGEVSEITGVKPYVLRYWESEFSILEPTKARSKHRLYRREDIDTIMLIKKLLYEEKLTIAGARRKLSSMRGKTRSSRHEMDGLNLKVLLEELETIKGFLS